MATRSKLDWLIFQGRLHSCSAVERLPSVQKDRSISEIVIAPLSSHPHLATQVVEIAWNEWGAGLSEEEHQRWLRLAEEDARLHDLYHAAFVALDDSYSVGVVQLHQFDIVEMADRSPWVCGMIVRPEYRGRGIGRRLLSALEDFAAAEGAEAIWVWTDTASDFYAACGWTRYGDVVAAGEPGTVFSRRVSGEDLR